MKGARVRRIRVAMGLTGARFACLLGCNMSTVYRWERTHGEVTCDPHQSGVLRLLEARMVRGAPAAPVLAAVAAAAKDGDGLRGLHLLLVDEFAVRRGDDLVARLSRQNAEVVAGLSDKERELLERRLGTDAVPLDAP